MTQPTNDPAAQPPAPAPAPPAPTPAPAQGTVTQEELNRIATREKEQGRQSALSQVAQDLGVPLEDAKRIIAESKAREDSEKTEAQKAREAADAERTAAAAEKAAAAKERHQMSVERALFGAGVTDPAKLTRAARMLDAEAGATAEAIAAEVEALKKDMPELFGAQAPATPPKAPNSDPKGTPPPPKPSEDGFARGAERALKRGNRGTPYPTAT